MAPAAKLQRHCRHGNSSDVRDSSDGERFAAENITVSIFSARPLLTSSNEEYLAEERGGGVMRGCLFAVWIHIHLPPAVKREVNQSDYAS